MRDWVLVVEDQRADALVLETGIRQVTRAVVRRAPDLATARRLLRDRPSLVLLDLALPDGNGMQVLAWMREQGMQDVPVVVVSSDAEPARRQACLAAGAVEHIVKPLDLEAMEGAVARTVRHWLGTIETPAD